MYFRYIEYPFIHYRYFFKKVGIAFCRALTNIMGAPESTDDEKRLVISKMGSIFSLLISVLITYNWFFMMFYKFQGERPYIPDFPSQMFKIKMPFVNFLLEFILYPLDAVNWFLMHKFPKWMDWLIPNNTVKFFAMYIISFGLVETYGACTIDLFYDSLKLLFNHSMKPWDELLHHTYPTGDYYSITLKTYWFFHLLILGGQVPSLIPSFYSAFRQAKETAQGKYDEMTEKSDAIKAEKQANLYYIHWMQ